MKTTAAATLVAAALTALAVDAATTTCNGACPENLKPLCASDGVTYDNECMFEFAKCQAVNAGKTPALTLVSTGRCPASSTPTPAPTPIASCAKDFACLQVIDPVCGSDGKTYNSACELKQVQCKTLTALTVKSKGECPSNSNSSGSNSTGANCAATMCTKEYKPVCGSDSKTYANKCEFANAQCKVTGSTKLTLKSETACDAASSVGGDAGASKPSAGNSSNSTGASNSTVGSCTTACTKEIAAVCGSNGVTYDNACLLKNAQCANATLTQVASTGCGSAPKSAAVSTVHSASAMAMAACALVLGAVASVAL